MDTLQVNNSNLASVQETPSSRLHPRLAEYLREADLFGAVTEVNSPRFVKYLMQPKQIMRNGWLLDPDMELGQSDVRAYVLHAIDPSRATRISQRLVIDRHERVATLQTEGPELTQEIRVDMQTMEVLDNRISTPVSLN